MLTKAVLALLLICSVIVLTAPNVLADAASDARSRYQADMATLETLPTLQWSQSTYGAWSSIMDDIEQLRGNWDMTNRILGAFLGAASSSSVPRNPKMSALLDRAVQASLPYKEQGVPLTVAKGLIWYGDFDKAYAMYPQTDTPEPLVEFAFETLADQPALAEKQELWDITIARMGSQPAVFYKAVRSLAYTGRLDAALAIADRAPTPLAKAKLALEAARYARYGKHDADFVRAMNETLAALSGQNTPDALPLFRDAMQEAATLPIAPLPPPFWRGASDWARALPATLRPAGAAELASAAAWCDRPDATSLLTATRGTVWEASGKLRVAEGLLWNGKSDAAHALAASITDPNWRAQAQNQLAYLAAQKDGHDDPK